MIEEPTVQRAIIHHQPNVLYVTVVNAPEASTSCRITLRMRHLTLGLQELCINVVMSRDPFPPQATGKHLSHSSDVPVRGPGRSSFRSGKCTSRRSSRVSDVWCPDQGRRGSYE